jgi:hypothetical protein
MNGSFYAELDEKNQKFFAALKEKDKQFIADLQGEDELGTVIRTHLYVEHYVNQIIDIVVPHPENLKSINLDFQGKVNLLVALGVDSNIKKPLIVLGKLRNKFAHQPDYKITKLETRDLYQNLSGKDKELLHNCYKTLSDIYPENRLAPKFKDLSPRENFTLLAIAIRGIIVAALRKVQEQKQGL